MEVLGMTLGYWLHDHPPPGGFYHTLRNFFISAEYSSFLHMSVYGRFYRQSYRHGGLHIQATLGYVGLLVYAVPKAKECLQNPSLTTRDCE